MRKLIETDMEAFDDSLLDMLRSYGYMFIFYDIHQVNDTDKNTSLFEIIKQALHQANESKNIMFKYIEYPVNTEAKTFKELFLRLDDVQTNDIANSCFLNLIINTYATKINQCRKTNATTRGNYKKFELNHQTLCDMLGIKMKNSDIGVTLEQSRTFFKKYNLSLKAVNIYGAVIFEETNQWDHHISPSTLYILVHNNHVHHLNCNDKSFQQILNFKKNKTIQNHMTNPTARIHFKTLTN